MDNISERKNDHLKICTDLEPTFRTKSNGLENYDFIHYALTEVDYDNIELTCSFFNKRIELPFIISCMTGGTEKADSINSELAIAASELKIPIGVGSQREMLDNSSNINSYEVIRNNAKNIPILGNLGAGQILEAKNLQHIQRLAETIEASAFVIHLNPLQELFQKEGQTNFHGLLNGIEKVVELLPIPVIIKEVGSGINKSSAEKLLNIGVKGIDVAGAGGTSWSAVEIIRNRAEYTDNRIFWDWGLPTSYCIRTVCELKSKFDFTLIASGGIKNGIDAAKAIALGADFAASARIVLKKLFDSGTDSVINMIRNWADDLKRIMFLTGSSNLNSFRNAKIIEKGKLI